MYFTEAFQCRNMPEKPLRLTRINCGRSVSNVSVQGLVARALLLHLCRYASLS